MFETIFVSVWPWWAGGVAIGLFIFLFFIFTGNPLGVSTGCVNLCKITLPTKGLKFFEKEAFKNKFDWRFLFVMGLIIGGLLSITLGKDLTFNFEKGFTMLATIFPGYLKYVMLFAGGILVGFGARFAGGCTSGHGIVGNAQFLLPSFISTICFMIGGFLMMNILFRVIGVH
ncbi:MAG TPA: YeeE/YedE thiosulfate transporter family protein [Candidatus Eremiobacteraeota bacterium]|nr:MAG: hypothetical protein BWY64_03681 [bacterium ADurb.Bin363]HPZ09350.1 YeeE/YedE thiosulfate transporter family protein [Candidatus Eremiobacteraeota bacterium]